MTLFLIAFATLFNLLQEEKLKDYSIEHHGITLSLNKKWNFEKVSDRMYRVDYKCKDDGFCQNFIFTFIANPDNKSIDQFLQTYLKMIPQRFKEHKIQHVGDTVINNINFKILDYDMTNEGVEYGGTSLLRTYNNRTVIIHYTALLNSKKPYKEERALFLETIKTIRFTQGEN